MQGRENQEEKLVVFKMLSFLFFQSEDILWRVWGRRTVGVDC